VIKFQTDSIKTLFTVKPSEYSIKKLFKDTTVLPISYRKKSCPTDTELVIRLQKVRLWFDSVSILNKRLINTVCSMVTLLEAEVINARGSSFVK